MTAPLSAGPLPALGLLGFEGPDAGAFLQGQCTQDLRLVTTASSPPAAICTPQGRVLALARLVARGDAILAVLPAELVPTLRDRLQRHVLRAKVRLWEPGADLAVWGVLAASPEGLEAALPGCPSEPGGTTTAGETGIVRLPGPRALVIGPPRAVARATPGALPLAPEAWAAAAIAAGEPQVVAATSEHWIPQMLNLDRVGALSFTKGCYTGQEVVTRTQHLGRLKRRMQGYSAAIPLALRPGQTLYAANDKVAEVVAAAPVGSGTQVLAVVNLTEAGMPLGITPGARDLHPSEGSDPD